MNAELTLEPRAEPREDGGSARIDRVLRQLRAGGAPVIPVITSRHEAGYDALGVARGDDALARLAEFAPDLILLDMLMPHMDGFREFLARLRARSPAAHPPLVMVSALGASLGHALDPEGSRVLGIAGILMKPVDVAVLLGAVRRIIGPDRQSGRGPVGPG